MNVPLQHEPVVATLVDASAGDPDPPMASPIDVTAEPERLTAEPYVPEPIVADQVETDPIETDPDPVVAEEPVAAEPVVAELDATEPVAAAPVVVPFAAEPIVAMPAMELPKPEPLTLEQRIEALERALRESQRENQHLEDRIAARVLEKMPESVVPKPRWYDRINPFRNVAAPAATGWLLFDLLGELRFVGAMIFDRRFGMSWMSRGVIAAALFLAFTIHIWLTPLGLLPLVGGTLAWLLTILVQLTCGALMYKILHRETSRYRTFLEAR